MAEEIIRAGFSLFFLGVAFYFGKAVGAWKQQELWRRHMEVGHDYRRAVDDLDRWCGHTSPHAKLIARQLKATGERLGRNIGTPVGDEACDISGLREQLRRLDAEQFRRVGGAHMADAKQQRQRTIAEGRWPTSDELAAAMAELSDDERRASQMAVLDIQSACPKKQGPAPEGPALAPRQLACSQNTAVGETGLHCGGLPGSAQPSSAQRLYQLSLDALTCAGGPQECESLERVAVDALRKALAAVPSPAEEDR